LGVGAEVSADGRYLVLNLWLGTDRRNRLYYVDLGDRRTRDRMARRCRLLDACDASSASSATRGRSSSCSRTWMLRAKRLVAIDLAHAERKLVADVVPQSDDVLESARVVDHRFRDDGPARRHSRLRPVRARRVPRWATSRCRRSAVWAS